jgi:hypothetical protein
LSRRSNWRGVATYDGPTWLDRVLVAKERVPTKPIGFGDELDRVLAERPNWLIDQNLAEPKPSGEIAPKPQMITLLRQREQARLMRLAATVLPPPVILKTWRVFQSAPACERVTRLAAPHVGVA